MTTIHEIHKQYNVLDDDIKILILHQFNRKTKEWKFVGYGCKHCGRSFKTAKTVMKHPSTCKTINTTKKQKDTEMPIQVVTKNGQRMYRYGDTGKLYSNRKDAEKQAAAIMASGYKEKKDMDKK
jgi:phage FluMu protein Com